MIHDTQCIAYADFSSFSHRRSVLLPQAFFRPLLQHLVEELNHYGENAGTNGKRSSMIIHWILDEVITLCSDQNSA
jgi:hypothetical protein